MYKGRRGEGENFLLPALCISTPSWRTIMSDKASNTLMEGALQYSISILTDNTLKAQC